MKETVGRSGVAVVLLVLIGCANQSYMRTDDSFVPAGWERLVVLPFSGNPRFSDLATSTFTLQMVGEKHFLVVQPDETKLTLTKLGIMQAENSITVLEAQKVARHFNAQGILSGNIDAYNNGLTLNAFATVKLIDASTGHIVAASHHPSGLLMGYSEQQCVIAAIEKVARDMNKVLLDLSRKNVPSRVIPNPDGILGENQI